ncbi:uracil-DNA glycosylase family protein [Porphyrobacter sp. CACIAM 03H1]|uniref:uracil-DNA glycosylase family protein n=1 Tax=Porphyrobacter sp. CACIAM 03H1 TaxID=2003315 RepID=UPI000B5A948C|nr:uracil-DNA glycosylase family protein [Porphyrobacter sp. CACIAM 03H1]ASJ90878.1 IclR family transcriptional regulator [Porphyrobacter sp. CACIAM 03H1]
MSAPAPGHDHVEDLRRRIAACTLCAAHLPAGPRPVARFSATARILIIGQAPGSKVHVSGIPWDDDSGDRLRGWLGIDKQTFYDAAKVAQMPMGFCYPGKASGGDMPPRRECAPQWHDAVLGVLPEDRLTLLVGIHAQARYLPHLKRLSLAERVARFGEDLPFVALPHPAWRSRLFMAKHPWFEAEVLPPLRAMIAQRLR